MITMGARNRLILLGLNYKWVHFITMTYGLHQAINFVRGSLFSKELYGRDGVASIQKGLILTHFWCFIRGLRNLFRALFFTVWPWSEYFCSWIQIFITTADRRKRYPRMRPVILTTVHASPPNRATLKPSHQNCKLIIIFAKHSFFPK